MAVNFDKLLALPPEERLRLAETLLASLPSDVRPAIPLLPPWQCRELDYLIDESDADGDEGRPADEVMTEIRRELWPDG